MANKMVTIRLSEDEARALLRGPEATDRATAQAREDLLDALVCQSSDYKSAQWYEDYRALGTTRQLIKRWDELDARSQEHSGADNDQ